jgi:hypothetical protein
MSQHPTSQADPRLLSAARYSLVAAIRDVDLSSPVRVPVDGVYRAKPRTDRAKGLPIAAIEKCACDAGNASIIKPARLRQRARPGALDMSPQQQRL